MISRRTLLAGVPAGLALTACTPTQLAQYQQDAQLVYQVIGLDAPIAEALGLAATLVEQVTSGVDQLKALSDGIVAALSATEASPLVQRFGAVAQTVIQALLGVAGLPAGLTADLTAAMSLIPLIEAAVGVLATPSADRAPTPDAASADAARARLRHRVAAG